MRRVFLPDHIACVPVALQLRLELLDTFGVARGLAFPPDHPQLRVKIHTNTHDLAVNNSSSRTGILDEWGSY